jgi:hydrogenase nickel incorporation protein HypA/HybF
MHELAVVESLLNLALTHAKRANAKRVVELNLVIGVLSGYMDDSIQFYWDALSRDTLCQGARLQFRHIPAVMTCQDCGHGYTMENELSPCPQCGSSRIIATAGDDFRLDSIDVET